MKKWNRAGQSGRHNGNLGGNGEMNFANAWCMGMWGSKDEMGKWNERMKLEIKHQKK